MAEYLTKSQSELEHTDELPVLSEEAILRFEIAAAAETGRPIVTAVGTADDPLEASVETLRAAIEAAEDRWAGLEDRLRSQDQAIAELRAALRGPAEPASGAIPPEARESSPDTSPLDTGAPMTGASTTEAPATEASTTEAPATGPSSASEADGEDMEANRDPALLERIAALEAYIAGRADRWLEMEQEVRSKAHRITELEAELAQRIGREQQLEERLHHEGGRSEALRDKLRQMNRKLEHAALGDSSCDLEATAELLGPAKARSGTWESGHRDPGTVPELVCLSSDLHERYVMDKAAITIGRSPACDIRISTGFVSREHATIRREDGDTIIEDRSSTNGVYVNAERVRRKALTNGDEITIGESTFRFVSASPPPH